MSEWRSNVPPPELDSAEAASIVTIAIVHRARPALSVTNIVPALTGTSVAYDAVVDSKIAAPVRSTIGV